MFAVESTPKAQGRDFGGVAGRRDMVMRPRLEDGTPRIGVFSNTTVNFPYPPKRAAGAGALAGVEIGEENGGVIRRNLICRMFPSGGYAAFVRLLLLSEHCYFT